jgi:catechol 2,3-dioxygenase-like lactoylglutathione lyase family enzyme
MTGGAWVVVLLQVTTTSAAAPQPKSPFSGVRGGFIALSVADVDASAKWYAEKLSLKIVRERSPSPDQKARTTALSGDGLIVELVQHADALPLAKLGANVSRPFHVHGIFKAGIAVDDLESTLDELRRRSVEIAFAIIEDRALGLRSFAIRDPDGNMIQIFGR